MGMDADPNMRISPAFFGPCMLFDQIGTADWNGESSLAAAVRACLTPDRSAITPNSLGQRQTIFLLGDSHVINLVPAIERLAADGSFAFRWAASGCGCSFGPKATWQPDTFHCGSATPENCEVYNNETMATVEDLLQPGDVVSVINAGWKYDEGLHNYQSAGGQNVDRTRLTFTVRPELLAAESTFFTTFGDAIQSKGGDLLLFQDSVILIGGFGTQCRRATTRADCDYEYPSGRTQWHEYHQMQQQLATAHPHIHTFDVWPLMCDTTAYVCGAAIPGTNIIGIFDADHFTEDGALYLEPHLCAALWGPGGLLVA